MAPGYSLASVGGSLSGFYGAEVSGWRVIIGDWIFWIGAFFLILQPIFEN